MECESDAVLFEVTKLLNDPTITRKVLRAVLRHKYNFSNELIDQLVPPEPAPNKSSQHSDGGTDSPSVSRNESKD